jgi:acylglycerol lipase
MNRRILLLGAACAAGLAACTPVTQRPGPGQLGYRGPRLDSDGLFSFDGRSWA